MKIAMMGAGALGGYFGGRLANAGHDVTLIARGAHLAALQTNGLQIKSPNGDLHLREISATDDPADVGPVDVVMMMVKTYDLAAAGQLAKAMVADQTMVITCQNGVSAPDILAPILGAGHIVPGVARISGEVSAPGVIRHSAPLDILILGERDTTISERVRAFYDALKDAGTSPAIAENINHELWSKFIGQSTLASITTLTRLDLGPLLDCPQTGQLFRDAMFEAERVGHAVDSNLPRGLAEHNFAFLSKFPRHMHASMLDDLNRGKPLEIEALSGDVVRLGAAHGVPTPIHAVFASALQPFAGGTPEP
jgi:2-dehydropantoate 2-reductase